MLVSLQRRPFGLYYLSSRVDNTEWKMIIIVFHIKILEISPGAIQKSNGLKVTCLMRLYFKSEEDTMKNLIFLRLYIAPPPHTRLRINIFIYQMYWRVLQTIKLFQSLYIPMHAFQLYNYYRQNLSHKWFIWPLKKYNKSNLSNKKVAFYELSATQIPIIQMPPHSPLTHILKMQKEKYIYIVHTFTQHLGELHKEWTEAGVSASRVSTLRHLQEKSYQATSESETSSEASYLG